LLVSTTQILQTAQTAQTAQTVWILAPRQCEPEAVAQSAD
jgi:hypothetical protein